MARILPCRYPAAAGARYDRRARCRSRVCALAAASNRRAARIEEDPMNDGNLRARRALRAAALLAAALALGIAFAPSAGAATLRWAGRGDMQTTDPHSQNENLTNNINPSSTSSWSCATRSSPSCPRSRSRGTQVNPTTWRFKLRPERQVPRRHAVHRRRRRVQLRAGARRHVAAARLRRTRPACRRGSTTSRSSSRPAGPNPIELEHIANINIMSRAWCEKNKRDEAAELHAEGGHDHRACRPTAPGRTC